MIKMETMIVGIIVVGSPFTQVRWAGQRWVINYSGELSGTALGKKKKLV